MNSKEKQYYTTKKHLRLMVSCDQVFTALFAILLLQ